MFRLNPILSVKTLAKPSFYFITSDLSLWLVMMIKGKSYEKRKGKGGEARQGEKRGGEGQDRGVAWQSEPWKGR